MLRWLSFWVIAQSFLQSKTMLNLSLDFNGKNVCPVIERFNVTVEVEEDYQYQYRVTEWCFSVPPRCTKYKTRWAKRKVPKVVEHQRRVTQCCKGYVNNGADCKAHCKEPCRHGACALPNTCHCFPGFRGDVCQDICKKGTWGGNCQQQCECQNDSYCNPMNGTCVCTPGWRGRRCDETCEAGYFGYECRKRCICEEPTTIPCHHITGECYYPSTTEPPTSTEVVTSTELSTTMESTSSEPTSEFETPTVTTTEEAYSSTEVSSSSPSPADFLSLLEVTEATSTLYTEEITSTIPSSTTLQVEISTSTEMSQISTSDPAVTTLEESTIQNSPEITTGLSIISYNARTDESYVTGTSAPTTKEDSSTVQTDFEKRLDETKLETAEGNSEKDIVRQSIGGLVITIVMSTVGSLILLIAVAGLAMARRRRKAVPPPPPQAEPDIGLYRFYAEETLPDMLEAEYDHPQNHGSNSSYLDHLYDELNLPPPPPQLLAPSFPKYF